MSGFQEPPGNPMRPPQNISARVVLSLLIALALWVGVRACVIGEWVR